MKDLIRSIGGIFSWVGRALNTVRVITLNLAFLGLVFFIVITLVSHNSKTEVKSSKSGALLLSLSGNIVEEKQPADPLSTVLSEKMGLDTLPTEILFQDVLDAITTAAGDPNITSIVLDLKNMGNVGLNQLQAIGKALSSFKESGKKVIAAEDFYQQKGYYLASFANEVYLNPMGAVDLHGIGTFRLFFKDAIEKLKINYHIFRVGTYKSAIEPLIRNNMSKAAKTQNLSWLNPLWKTIAADISRERKLSEGSLSNYTENIASELTMVDGDTARLALETGLVDELKTREELRSYLVDLNGEDTDGNFSRIALTEYLKTVPRSYSKQSVAGDSIGIIIAQGAILNGEQPIGSIGGDTLAQLIRKARETESIKGLVLRIISGGGSVFASEIIRQEILEFKKSKKPLVVSMGAMAASGGYWIAADADEIWSSPVTLTGSIGIFAAIPTFEETLSTMGIYSDGVGTTSLAAALNVTQALHPSLKESIQISVNHGYDQFINIVASGRAMDLTKVKNISEGRVFDGATAQKIGLVDKLGTLKDAVASAADLAGLEEYNASYIRKPLTVKDEIIQLFSRGTGKILAAAALPSSVISTLKMLFSPVSELVFFNDPKGLYARCPIYRLSF